MASTTIDASLMKVFLTSTGYIALCSNQLGADDEADLFGSNGKIPPRPLSDLIQDMLADLQGAPEASDTLEIRHLETELKSSLSYVQDALKRT